MSYIETEKKIDLKAAQKALGQVQAALIAVTDAHNKLAALQLIDHNFRGDQSLLNEFFVNAENKISKDTETALISTANPTAEDLLNDQSDTLAQRLKQCFAEQNRNVASYTIFSRRNKTLNDITDAFQNMLTLEVSVRALHTNFTILAYGDDEKVKPLLEKYESLLEKITTHKPEIAQSLGIDENTLAAREEFAGTDLRNSTYVTYIPPLTQPA